MARTRIIQREERLCVPLALWKQQTAAVLRPELRAAEKVLLVPERAFLSLNLDSFRVLGEYRVRRDGHSQHYYAVAVPEGYNPAVGSHGGWVPAAGRKAGQGVRHRPLAFKPTLFLEERSRRLFDTPQLKNLPSRNAKLSRLVQLGLAEVGGDWAEVPRLEPEKARTTKTVALRLRPSVWEEAAARYQRPGESRTSFLRRLLWIGVQSLESRTPEKPNPQECP